MTTIAPFGSQAFPLALGHQSYPQRRAASANNWRDHFPGSSLNGRWGTITSGTGTATVTDSYVDLNTGGINSAAALFYGTQLDKTRSQLWLAAISFPSAGIAGFAPYNMALVNGATTPVADTKNNWAARLVSLRTMSGGGGILDEYFDTGGTTHFWDGQNVSPAFTTTFSGSLASQTPARDDDYYISGLEIDAVNQRFRWLGWAQSFVTAGTFTVNQGWRLFSLTDWVPWSSVRDTTNLWLMFGTPFNNDAGASHECRVEWVKYAEAISVQPGTTNYVGVIDAWGCAKDVANATTFPLRHYYSYDGEIFVPEDRTTIAVNVGTTGAFDDTVVQEPCVVFDGVATDVMFYTGNNSSFAQAIGVATAPHHFDGSPQMGPWTKSGSNPIISVGTSGADDDSVVGFSCEIIDYTESDTTKRWKMIYAGKKVADSKWRSLLATAPDWSGPWTKQATVLNVGAGGANDEIAARDIFPVFDKGQWEYHYEAWDASGVTHHMVATSPTFGVNLTKQGTFNSYGSNVDTAITADVNTAPGRTITVASTAGFVADQLVGFAFSTNANNWCVSRIRKIVNSTTMELYHGVTGLLAATPARVKALDSCFNMTPREIWLVGSEWWFYINFWEWFTHTSEQASYGGILEEGYLFKHAMPHARDAVPTIDWLASPSLPRGFGSINSAENISTIRPPFNIVPMSVDATHFPKNPLALRAQGVQ